MITDTTPHYAAFISYAHADEAVAARLHKALETYPVPKHLRAEGRTTRPIFRDVAELTAAHSLSEKIRDAVNGSRVLIVLCSPAAKASHWVNEEIKLFREIHGDGAILSALIEGTPATSFPEALVQDGREPLAASLGASNAGFRLGVTQLAAGILGTGLDELVQRGAKRRTRRMGIGLAASLAFSALMGFTAYQAVDARNEAELERGESEALLGYMIKDLKVKLEPVGRLELLEGVGKKAIEYYDKKDIEDLSDDSLRILAAARQVVAQVALDAGRMKEAQNQIEASSDLTREVLARNPDDTDAIYAHAQSEYFVGAYYRKQKKNAEMEKPYREYNRLAQQLYQKDPTNFDWVMEAGWGQNNLGLWARDSSTQELAPVALEGYTKSIHYFEKALSLKPDSKLARTELARSMSGKSFMLLALETAEKAREYNFNYREFLKALLVEYPNDIQLKSTLYLSETDYYNAYFLRLDENNKETLAEALDQLFYLTQHDPENLKYKTYFLKAVSNAFGSLDETKLRIRRDQIEFLLNGLPESDGFNTEYYTSMSQIFDIKIDILNGKKISSSEKIKALNHVYSNKEAYSIDDWKLIYNIFLQNQEIGDKDSALYFASLFLTQMNARSDLNYPTVVFRKLMAQMALENCNAVIPLAKDLKARGYLGEADLNLKSCSAP